MRKLIFSLVFFTFLSTNSLSTLADDSLKTDPNHSFLAKLTSFFSIEFKESIGFLTDTDLTSNSHETLEITLSSSQGDPQLYYKDAYGYHEISYEDYLSGQFSVVYYIDETGNYSLYNQEINEEKNEEIISEPISPIDPINEPEEKPEEEVIEVPVQEPDTDPIDDFVPPVNKDEDKEEEPKERKTPPGLEKSKEAREKEKMNNRYKEKKDVFEGDFNDDSNRYKDKKDSKRK